MGYRIRVIPLQGGRHVQLPADRNALDAMDRAGGLPLALAPCLTLGEAVGLCRMLPEVGQLVDGLPSGYGLLPPRGAEPLVRLSIDVRSLWNGCRIPAGHQAMVGALWSVRSRVVLRLWYSGVGERLFRGQAVRGPVDTYSGNVATVCGLEGKIPQFTGWELARLNAPVEGPGDKDTKVNPIRMV